MAHTIYSNFIIENEFENALLTALDINNFVTSDTSLAAEAGMIVKVNRYSTEGSAETLGMGEGNTAGFTVSVETTPYEAKYVQSQTQYYDEQALTDPAAIEKLIADMKVSMVNDLTTKAVAEMEKTSKTMPNAAVSYDTIQDAIAELNIESGEGNLFMLINPKTTAKFKKALKADLSYVTDFVRNSYVGHIAGIPVYTSKAVLGEDEIIISSKDAVKVWTKKGVEVEQKREPNTRSNEIYVRKCAVVALVDDRKTIVINPKA